MRKKLHENGPELSRFISGMWRLRNWDITTGELIKFIDESIEAGVTTFDHADIYGCYSCQEIFGKALKEEPSLRDKMELITKAGIKTKCEITPGQVIPYYDTSKEHLTGSVENSLRQLNTDYVDLLLIHRPSPVMDPAEIAETFYSLKEAGKVKHFGVSNFTVSQFEMLQSYLDFPLVTNQVEYSVMHTAPLYDGTFDLCLTRRIKPQIWSPLAGGRLFKNDTEQAQRVTAELELVTEETGAPSIDVTALAWILAHPSDPVIVLGTGKIERLKRALSATDIELTREQWFRILKASVGNDVP